jgi:uncharacterized protein YqgC (DUF456 family)
MDQHALLYLVSAALILIGVVGIALPVLPGVPLVFAGMLLAAWADDFRLIPVWVIVVLAVLTALALLIDIVATMLGAKRVGASRLAIVGAAIGTIVGLFFNVPGLVLGPFIGALSGEWLHSRDMQHATRVGIGTWTGMVLGAVFKLMLTCVMLGLFVLSIVMHR